MTENAQNTIRFSGGARHVTGANYLVSFGDLRVVVDCGMFQGCHDCEGRNFNDFAYDPSTVEALFITHAHIDHTGRVPSFVKHGFKGRIYSTAATRDLAEAILRDSIHILEEELRVRDRGMLYDANDLKKAMEHWEVLDYHQTLKLPGGVRARLLNAGHILGSAMVELAYPAEGGEKFVVFTGDVGNAPSIFVPEPEVPPRADVVVIEAAYGDRLHDDPEPRKTLLKKAIEDVIARKGTLMIPAFAMERTQELIFELNELVEHGEVPPLPVFIDSPLAIKITNIFKTYRPWYADRLHDKHDDIFAFPGLRFTESTQDSKAINDVPQPKVVIAGSGMSNAGRILHHERRYLSDRNSILLIAGYQVAGSLGRRLLDGEKSVKIMQEIVEVRCEVRQIQGYSAHADQRQLFELIAGMPERPKLVFTVQGEESATLGLGQLLKDRLGVEAKAPMFQDVYGI